MKNCEIARTTSWLLSLCLSDLFVFELSQPNVYYLAHFSQFWRSVPVQSLSLTFSILEICSGPINEVLLFVQRLISDHDNAPAPLRKPLSLREGVLKHQACAGFLHYLRVLQKMAPAADFDSMKTELHRQFAFGYLDPDIQHSLETQVPPGDIRQVGAFRQELLSVVPCSGSRVQSFFPGALG